jgi:hypothetical protein
MKIAKRYFPFVFWGIVCLVLFHYFHKTGTNPTKLSVGTFVSDKAKPELRTGYRGAVIKWGITSADEFERARLNDPEIAEACQVGFLHPVTLTQDVWKSVAYRQISYEEQNGGFQRGSRIFWTPVIKIPAGELVYEDDQGNIVRGRCGNCTRNAPPEKSFVMPPAPPDVDTLITEFTPPEIIAPPPELFGWPPMTPVIPFRAPGPLGQPPETQPEQPPFAPPAQPPLTPPELPYIPPPIIIVGPPSGPGLPAPPPGSSPVPPLFPPPTLPILPSVPIAQAAEPGTVMLFAVGLAVLAILRQRRKRSGDRMWRIRQGSLP